MWIEVQQIQKLHLAKIIVEHCSPTVAQKGGLLLLKSCVRVRLLLSLSRFVFQESRNASVFV
jgi:hypothetical protein